MGHRPHPCTVKYFQLPILGRRTALRHSDRNRYFSSFLTIFLLLFGLAASSQTAGGPLVSAASSHAQVTIDSIVAEPPGLRYQGVPPAIPQDEGTAGLHLEMLRLSTTARLMQVVAHPDDEDGGMLT